METNKNFSPEITVDEKGCATVCGDIYSAWHALDLALAKNGCSLNGYTLRFDDVPSAVRWLKRAAEFCFLFRLNNMKAWVKVGPEAEVSK